MLLFASGMVVASTSTVAQRLPAGDDRDDAARQRAWASSLAPATESIMGSLPRDKAGVGSAVNDTSREVGGALGVAIDRQHAVVALRQPVPRQRSRRTCPRPARDAADESVGAALGVSAQLGRVGRRIADAAREAFVYAMSRASLVTAAVAVVGAFVAWRFLPARAHRRGRRPRRRRDRRGRGAEP